MIDLVATRPTTTLAVAVGAAMLTGQIPYPTKTELFQSQQVGGTYSAFMESLQVRSLATEQFAMQVSAIYSALAARQEQLGEEFEAAIFGDLEGLYED